MLEFFQSVAGSVRPTVQADYFFLIGGQSNTGTNTTDVTNQSPTGRVPYVNLPTPLRSQQENTLFWDGSGFTAYTHPVNDEYGWINHFFFNLNQAGIEVNFYKSGLGGSQLGTGGTPYTRDTLKNNGLSAWLDFQDIKSNPKIIFLWCQGFSDGVDETNSLNYGAHEIANPDHATGGNLGAWFEEVRTHFLEANMPIIYNTLSNNATSAAFRANVKLGQEYVATLSENNYVLDADNLQFLDGQHFGASGVIDLANLYVNQFTTIAT